MITKTKDVYYCEYCKKHGLSKAAMANHELHCTLNPNRICGLCGSTSIAPLIEKYSNRFIMVPDTALGGGETAQWIGEPVTLDEIRDDVESCPICTLAIIRQCNLNKTEIGPAFDYAEEHKEWWDQVNADREEGYY